MEMGERRRLAVDSIQRERVSAIIRTDDMETADAAMKAAVAGGFRVIEFTCTTPGVLELIEKFAQIDGVIVGAGTVMTKELAAETVGAGASFLVSPITDGAIIEEAHRLGVACIPGAYTPTEMETAHRFGADFIKVFPAPAGGVDFIKALRGPLPHHKLFPTAGPTPENFISYLEAGCAGVGFVRSLFVPELLVSRDFDGIRKIASGVITKLSDWAGRT
jgi:2-dehydro-3-deoxyphosphogluconate aldolase/(4S)-4-hydroxy-2-oxoglutarate aldolase